jgi:hypothetical protein
MLKSLQHQGSIDFRRCFNNLELLRDPTFLSSLNIKSSKFKEYLVKEVLTFNERLDSSKERILEKIIDLEKKNDPKSINRLIDLKRSYKSNVVFGGRFNLEKRRKGLISKEEFRDKRLYPLTFYGETSRKGNRFFDLSNLSSGKLIFKLESTNVKMDLNISTLKHKDVLPLIEKLSIDKQIPVTIKLTHEKICISYDESILNNSNFDRKLYSNDSPVDKIERKEYWRGKFQEHEKFLKEGKLDRYLSIDLNPNQIGFVICDVNLNILDKGSYEIEGKVSSNKRKYEYSMIIKQLFEKIKHYKCSYLITETLEGVVKEDHGNKVSNRKIKNEWKLNYIKGILKRKCNETKTILREVNPVYSSFIGNLTYNYYDPISSAMELCRRGINKFKKSFKLIPDFNPSNIMTDISNKIQIDCNAKNYQEVFKSIRNQSYRRKTKIFSSYLLNKHSHVCLYF